MKTNIIIVLLLSFIFTACSTSNYTMNIPSSKLQKQISKNFPINQDMIIGKMNLSDPLIKLNGKTNRIITALSFGYKPPFFKQQNGTLSVSGSIFYNKDKAAFFLKNPLIEDIKFNNNSLTSNVPNSIKDTISKIVNIYFQKHEIYKLKDDSLKSRIYKRTMKSIKVKDDKIELTLGL